MTSTVPYQTQKSSSRPPHTITPLKRVKDLEEWISEHTDDAIDGNSDRADDLVWALDHEDREAGDEIVFQPFIQSFSNTFCAGKMRVASCELVDSLPEGPQWAGKTTPDYDHEGNIMMRVQLCRSPPNWQEGRMGNLRGEAIVNCLMHELVHADIGSVCCWSGCGQEVAECRDEFWQQGGSTGHAKTWHLLAKMIEKKAKSYFSFEVNLERPDALCVHRDPKWSEISREDAEERFTDYNLNVESDRTGIWLEGSHPDGRKWASERFRKSRRSGRSRKSKALQRNFVASKDREVVGA